MEKLIKWCEDNNLNTEIVNQQTVKIPEVGTFYLVEPKNGLIITENFSLNLSEVDLSEQVDFYTYEFGGNYYYIERIHKTLELKPLLYLGKPKSPFSNDYAYLGIHTHYELLNSSMDFKRTFQKAKFLGYKTLGVCDKNTLGGALKFQLGCQKNDIKPILGESVYVKDIETTVKLYAPDEKGWQSLLRLNKYINVDNGGFITEKQLIEEKHNLILVFNPATTNTELCKFNSYKGNVYYQLDSVEFDTDTKDKEYLLNLKMFTESRLAPVLINDTYYLHQYQSDIKKTLNTIKNERESFSHNQHFKTFEDNLNTLAELFEDSDQYYKILIEAKENANKIADSCNFVIDTSSRHLPKYIMTKEESEKYADTDEMFWDLISKGLAEKAPSDQMDKYLERIQYEYEIIKSGDVLDYFIITWDIIRFCKNNDILTGIGRGSSGGSQIANILDITRIDPFDYGLIFERFLNPGRVKKSLPDIDTDVSGVDRDKVKHYIERKYGLDQVCSVGTYSTMKVKAAIKDISKYHGVDFTEANIVTKFIDDKSKWKDVFALSQETPILKKYIQKHPEVLSDVDVVEGNPKATSIHAAAVMIFPSDKTVFEWIPVRKVEISDGSQILVSEWEGEELDEIGFLKQDILGLKQLSKFKSITDLITEVHSENIDIYNLPLDDKNVYALFQLGFNSDVFQFGGRGLRSYCRELKPENIHDLIATNALYRPGAMDVNSHNEYVFRKHGKRKTKYHTGTEEATSETFGLVVYQEQVMEICRTVGGFTLEEADDIRKAMGKKKKELIDSYKDRFVGNAVAKGMDKTEVETIWHELEVHSGYSFNKSHSGAYAKTAYVSQWLKYNYPLQFWTTAFEFARDEDINVYISEINHTDDFIKIKPPSVNTSGAKFKTDYEKAVIYWSLGKVKQVGEIALGAILKERENGSFFSLEEFMRRVPKSNVNKQVLIHLILAGSFDEIEGIQQEKDRMNLIDKYFEISKAKKTAPDAMFESELAVNNWWWQIKQKELSGFGTIDYNAIAQMVGIEKPYMDLFHLNNKENEGKSYLVGGTITKITERRGNRGLYASLLIESNNEEVWATIWNDEYMAHKDMLTDCEGSIILLYGVIKFDNYRKNNSIRSTKESLIFVL